jgi:hypothetical protein
MSFSFRSALLALAPALLLLPATGCAPSPSSPSVISTSGSGSSAISLDYPDTDIRDLLTDVSAHFGLDLDLPRNLNGRTSLKLHDVTWPQIFAVVLEPISYDFYEDRGRVIVRTREDLERLPPLTERIVLRHQDPAIVKLYLARLHPEVSVTAHEAELEISVDRRRLQALRSELHELDRPDVSLARLTQAVYLPNDLPGELALTRFDPTTNSPLTTLIIVVDRLDAFKLLPLLRRELDSIPGAQIRADARVNALLLTAPESLGPQLRAIVAYLDDARWLEAHPTP